MRQYASGNDHDITPVCLDSALTIPAQTNEPNAEVINPGHDYGSVTQARNPAWFYLEIETGGTLALSQTNSNNIDVDGVLWGPFNSVADLVRDGFSSSYDTTMLASDYAPGSSFNFSVVEGGAIADYEVTLYRQPAANVTITIASTLGEATPSPTSLTFTTANWDVAQSVTLTAVDDSVLDGDVTDTITNTASSTDTNYDGLTVNVAVVAEENNDLSAPTINALLTNDTTPTLTGSHDSLSTLSMTVNSVTHIEGDGNLFDNSNNTWTLQVPAALSEGPYNVAATSTYGPYTLSDLTSGELMIDTTGPAPTISISSITSDDVINTAEASGSVTISGIVGGKFTTGNTVTVTIGGNDFTNTVDGTGTFGVNVVGSLLAANRQVTASIVTTDASGNSSTGTISHPYSVGTTNPVTAIALDNITLDNTVNAAEAAGTISVTGTVSGDFTTGDAVQLVIDANTYQVLPVVLVVSVSMCKGVS